MKADPWFAVAMGILFVTSGAATVYLCGGECCCDAWVSGDRVASSTWTCRPAETWPGASAAFLGMWSVMMVAMMTPCLAPMLASFRRVRRESGALRLAGATALAATGYFSVWTLLGAAAYPLGVGLAAAELRWAPLAAAAPAVAGVVLVLAGAAQLTRWKARQLGCCIDASACVRDDPVPAPNAFLHGVRLGWRCCLCCSSYTAALFALGAMNLAVMGAFTVAMAIERNAPGPLLVARGLGGALLASGVVLLLHAIGGS